jgi:hypothetical protein
VETKMDADSESPVRDRRHAIEISVKTNKEKGRTEPKPIVYFEDEQGSKDLVSAFLFGIPLLAHHGLPPEQVLRVALHYASGRRPP